MKNSTLILVPAIAFLSLTACKSKKPVTTEKQQGMVEVTVPFSTKEFRSDAEHFRSKQSGRSPDQATAKKIAYQNARGEMAGNINALVKRVTDQYTNQRTVGNTQEFENKFEELSREVVNLQMSNVAEIGEKIFQDTGDKSWTYWIAIEAKKSEVFDKIDQKISSDAKLKLDYDKKKFEDIFNAEMKKLGDEGK